jgi:anti-sigma B factor antagonist
MMTSDAHFEAVESEQSGMPVLRAQGEIDVASAPEFHASLSDLIREDTEILIVDLSEVSFMDSTGLGVLVGVEKQMSEAGHEMRLVVTQPQITRLLELTGLNEVFTIVSSRKDAVRT